MTKKQNLEQPIKYAQSETIWIKRSQINFAPYNPKNHSKEAVTEQRRNIKRVGILGGLVWNKTTGNLISGHKRTMALDEINKYDGTPATDYDIKVEAVEFNEKTEKEQNVYMDSRSTNTEQDYDLLKAIMPEIDYKNAGLTDYDMAIMGVDLDLGKEDEGLAEVMANQKSREEKIQHVKDIKAEVRKGITDKVDVGDPILTLSFDNFKNKASFMRRFGFDDREKFIKGEIFAEMVERIE